MVERTVQEVFVLPSIREIEKNILDIQRNDEVKRGYNKTDAAIIRRLLLIRKHLLGNEFFMSEECKRLLGGFNDALLEQLIRMRNEGIKTYESHVLLATKR